MAANDGQSELGLRLGLSSGCVFLHDTNLDVPITIYLWRPNMLINALGLIKDVYIAVLTLYTACS